MTTKFIDQLNNDLDALANEYAGYNASGIPCNWPHQHSTMRFESVQVLPRIALNSQTPSFLRNLARLLEKYI